MLQRNKTLSENLVSSQVHNEKDASSPRNSKKHSRCRFWRVRSHISNQLGENGLSLKKTSCWIRVSLQVRIQYEHLPTLNTTKQLIQYFTSQRHN